MYAAAPFPNGHSGQTPVNLNCGLAVGCGEVAIEISADPMRVDVTVSGHDVHDLVAMRVQHLHGLDECLGSSREKEIGEAVTLLYPLRVGLGRHQCEEPLRRLIPFDGLLGRNASRGRQEPVRVGARPLHDHRVRHEPGHFDRSLNRRQIEPLLRLEALLRSSAPSNTKSPQARETATGSFTVATRAPRAGAARLHTRAASRRAAE